METFLSHHLSHFIWELYYKLEPIWSYWNQPKWLLCKRQRKKNKTFSCLICTASVNNIFLLFWLCYGKISVSKIEFHWRWFLSKKQKKIAKSIRFVFLLTVSEIHSRNNRMWTFFCCVCFKLETNATNLRGFFLNSQLTLFLFNFLYVHDASYTLVTNLILSAFFSNKIKIFDSFV